MPPPPPPPPPKRSHHHSPTSGLSWNQTIHTTPSIPLSSQLHDLLHKPIGVAPKLQSMGNGVDALETMAMRCVLRNLEGLEEGSLDGVPGIVLERIWRGVVGSNLQTLHLWQLFTKIGTPDSSPAPLSFKTTTHHHIPISFLAPYISCSPTTHLTTLTLVSSIADPTPSLQSICTLPNLVSLCIIGSSSAGSTTKQTFCMINDDTLRLWNKKARLDKMVFSRLKYLFLRFQIGVTEAAFMQLDQFPKLEMVVTSRCGVRILNKKSLVKERRWRISRKAFYAHANTLLASSPQGKNYLDVVESYITASVAGTPLCFVQVGQQSPSLSTNTLFDVEEVECWVRDTETRGQEKRERIQDEAEMRQESAKKIRKIKDAKK